MTANAMARKIIKELNFDFSTFTMHRFLCAVEEQKGREMITVPWNMPPTMFGAWISDGDEPREYIFYRNDVLMAHQLHIQLHELSHFLFGHPTLKVNRTMIADVVAGKTVLPFAELPQLRSYNKSASFEVEAETLANLIQERVIQNSLVGRLMYNTFPEEKLADFLKGMRPL